MTIVLPTSPFDKYHEMIESIFSSSLVSNCTVHYPALRQDCSNCYNMDIFGVSSNTYRTGGPYPFSTPELCPYCQGLGHKNLETTDTLKLRCYYDKKSWNKINIPIGIPDGSVWTLGKMEDLMKVRRAAYVTMPNQNTTAYSYTLFGEPIPWGFGKDRYFSAFWERGKSQ